MTMKTSSRKNGLIAGMTLGVTLGLIGPGQAVAQDASHPVIAGFGAIEPIRDVANLPDPSLRYRVAFEVTRGAADPGQINPALDRVARFVNLMGASRIKPNAGDIVVVIHGPAPSAVLNDTEYRQRFNKPNPNLALIETLGRAGVSIDVCSYALANAKIAHEQVAKGVKIDLAAMVTLSTLQLKGWVLLAG